MRSILATLTLVIALAPSVEALTGGPSYGGCDPTSARTAHDMTDTHANHHTAADAPMPETQDHCGCGCDCGPAHGCTAASTAAPAAAGTALLFADALAPAAAFRPFSSRFDTPLYRPPISRLTI
ncbi:MAG: hypothetical protein ACREVN_12725 [Gammaproteobacteria bacterium]